MVEKEQLDDGENMTVLLGDEQRTRATEQISKNSQWRGRRKEQQQQPRKKEEVEEVEEEEEEEEGEVEAVVADLEEKDVA